jgi:hypothetical protein
MLNSKPVYDLEERAFQFAKSIKEILSAIIEKSK